MFESPSVETALRARLREPNTDQDQAARDRELLELVRELPLSSAQLALCEALEESPADFMAERNALFQATWETAAPKVRLDPPAILEHFAETVAVLTERSSRAEILLEVIGWRMSAEREPKLQALLLEALTEEDKK